MLCEPHRAERNGVKNPIQGNKKRPRQLVKDESAASWYHLGSPKPHSSDLRECGTKRPILLRVDGRTRRGLSLTLSRAAPRPCSAWRSVPVPSCPGSLYRTSTRTLLFPAFERLFGFVGIKFITEGHRCQWGLLPRKRVGKGRTLSTLYKNHKNQAASLALLSPAFRLLRFRALVLRRSRRLAVWVPRDWKICTMMTSRMTDTYSTRYIRR